MKIFICKQPLWKPCKIDTEKRQRNISEARRYKETIYEKKPPIRSDVLEKISDYVTAGEVDSGVETIIEHNPDIVFLDINMPGKNGFELITKVNELKMNTTVIFTTAYYEYAVDAFEKDVFGWTATAEAPGNPRPP